MTENPLAELVQSYGWDRLEEWAKSGSFCLGVHPNESAKRIRLLARLVLDLREQVKDCQAGIKTTNLASL